MTIDLAAPRSRLYSGAPWWLMRDGIGRAVTAFRDSADVVIVGAGCTGALLADALVAAGRDVVVLDRRMPATGSTAASTALLLYELDIELLALRQQIGAEAADRAYQLSAASVDQLERIAATLPDDVGFERRTSIYLASEPTHTANLQREADARQRIGIAAEFCSADDVANEYGLPGHGAVVSPQAAVIDPLRFTRALLARAERGGASILPYTTALSVDATSRGVTVSTTRGTIHASWLVLACGYEVPVALRPPAMSLHTTFVLVTDPVDDPSPLNRCTVWESARPYLYLRAADNRLMIGGFDLPYDDDFGRDDQLAQRARCLEAELRRLLPERVAPTAFSWAGTFAETRDALPIVGALPGVDRVLYALGYGGNGITFSVVVTDMLRDRCLGISHGDSELFRPGR